MTPVQVVGAERAHHRDPFPVQHPAEERDQVPGGPVGPVQVLQDQQHRAVGGQLGQQAEHRTEQLLLGQPGDLPVGRAGRAVRQQPAEHRPGGQRLGHRPGRRAGAAFAQRVGQRQVRDAVAELGAPAGQHQEAPLGRPRGQFGDQPGLAHPGISADQRVGWAAGAGIVEQAEQAGEFTVPADQPSR